MPATEADSQVLNVPQIKAEIDKLEISSTRVGARELKTAT